MAAERGDIRHLGAHILVEDHAGAAQIAELAGVYRTIRDKRIKDPVGVSLSTRAFIFQINDFDGMQVHSVQCGSVENIAVWDAVHSVDVLPHQIYYPNPDDHTQELGYTGSIKLPGAPICSTANNIN